MSQNQLVNRTQPWILPIIVIAQFFCTSLWFAGNGVLLELTASFNLEASALGHLTSAVQLGFILGTMVFAILTIADRFSPSKVFLFSAVLGALFNLGIILPGNNFISLIAFRLLTGFFLAGIYPIGMKIAADYYTKGLGKSLGFLVGALVVGTAFPHLLKGLTLAMDWQVVIIGTSILAIIGGILMLLLVPDGPYRKAGARLDFFAFFRVFKDKEFKAAAFGYFGHMWELYTFWAFVPVILLTYQKTHPGNTMNIPFLAFLIIGLGGVACVLGGYFAQSWGTKRTAFIALLLSCICCLISPLIFDINNAYLFIGFLLFWGMVVVADSPLFSTLVAQNAKSEIKGTALTIVNSLGFTITIISLQLVNFLQSYLDPGLLYVILAIGPILGLFALMRSDRKLKNQTYNRV